MEENQSLLNENDRISYGTEAVTINKLSKQKTNISIAFVLITETLERFAFYGLLCNMTLTLNSNPFQWSSYNSVNGVMIFNGISYFMTLVGGLLADSLLGKFWTISIFFLLYISGYAFWPSFYGPENHLNCSNVSSVKLWCDPDHNSTENVPLNRETCSSIVFLALALTGIGYGCVRVNIVPFGAQQVEKKGKHSLRMYFNWLYWCINVGALLAYVVLGYVQQELSYFYGYITPVCALILAWGIFISGSWFYSKKFELTGSPLRNIIQVICSSMRLSCFKNSRRLMRVTSPSDERSSGRNYPTDVSCLDRASVINGGDCSEENVTSTKAFFKILLVFLCFVPYWTVYYQIQTTFLVQGLHMRLDFGNSGNETINSYETQPFRVAASWLSLFNIVFVILIVPLLDRVIYPLLDKARRSPTVRSRVLFGMFFSMAAMVVAGIVERVRLKTYWGEDNLGHAHIQYIACTTYYAADMSIFWQAPQYLLIAVSEVFTSIAGLEMAYICAPQAIQSVIMGLFYCSQGIGSLVGVLVIFSLEKVWFSYYDFGNINCIKSPFTEDSSPENSCHLDYYFYVLAGVQAIGIIVFALAAFLLDIGGDEKNERYHPSPSKRIRNRND